MSEFGTELRNERESRGIGLDTISEATKISNRHLLALEASHFDQLPDAADVQALERVAATLPMKPGQRELREFEYKRNGTAVLFAALSVHEGTLAGWVTDSSRSSSCGSLASARPSSSCFWLP